MKNFIAQILFAFLLITYHLSLISFVHAQATPGFNVASTYKLNDKDALSGDIIILAGENGLVRGNVSYDSRIFGVFVQTPTLVLRQSQEPEATSSTVPVIRAGETLVNVTDFNGEIKKGDYVTSSPISGKGMRAGQSGYVLGAALENAQFLQATQNFENKQIRNGTVRVALRIEYAELTTARSASRLLDQLNAAFFRNIQDPEKFTLTIRYIIAGIIAILAFAIGFFWVSRSISKAVEAVGRNPLARQSILASVILQIVLTLIGAGVTIVIIFLVIRL